jgi:hypothetical protein
MRTRVGGGEHVRAELAKTLAAKLDSCHASDSAAAAAIPGLVRELNDIISGLGWGRSKDAVDEIVERRRARIAARQNGDLWKPDCSGFPAAG